MKNDKVIAPEIFRINPFKTSREEKSVPNKPTKASVRTKPITVSPPNVIHKQNLNSNSNDLSSTGVDNTAKTRRPQPRCNIKNDRVPSAFKSSCIENKEVEVEKHHRNLLLSKNKKRMSYECNNIKLAIQNDKSKVVCAMCKQCLITSNHDVCVLNYVNDMNSRVNNFNANVSNIANNKKHKPKVKKSKKVGSKERLASPKPSKPRIYLRWSPTGRIFDLKGQIIASSESECQYDSSNGDNACTSNPQEPTIKRFPNSTSFLGRSHIGGQPSAATITAPAAQAPSSSTDTNNSYIHQYTHTDTNKYIPQPATIIPNTSQDVDELEPEQQHVQQQDDQAQLQTETVANNVPNAMLDGNTFVNPFTHMPTRSAAESQLHICGSIKHAYSFNNLTPHEYQ
ncbi:hypothetical protein Tco_1210654 [Tanacetum coccineum]